MAKYLVLYNSALSASELMAQSSPEKMKASMAEWIQWRDKDAQAIKVEFGMPLQTVSRVTNEGLAKSDIAVGGYSIMEGEKDALLEVLKNHPHLKREGASIDLLEML